MLLILVSQVILDPKSSRKIFELARDQQEELDGGDEDEDEDEDEDGRADFSVPRSQFLQDDDDDDLGDYDEDDEEEVEEIVRKVLFILTRAKHIAGSRRGRSEDFGRAITLECRRTQNVGGYNLCKTREWRDSRHNSHSENAARCVVFVTAVIVLTHAYAVSSRS